MQVFTQKWTIAAMLEPTQNGKLFSYKSWPPHITLADIFSIDWNTPGLLDSIDSLTLNQSQFDVIANTYTNFGSIENYTQVVTYQPSPEIQSLHTNLISLLFSAGVVFDNPQFTGDGFVAHSSNYALPLGSIVKIKDIAVIDMFPANNPYMRKVYKTFILGK